MRRASFIATSSPRTSSSPRETRQKVLDFGLAKFATSAYSDAAQTMFDAVQTQQGQAMGTVAYMAPEQVRGEDLDPRADIFALGIVLYEMAAGKRPYDAPTSGLIFDAILNRSPPPTGADPGLERVILKALEKDRALRSGGRGPQARPADGQSLGVSDLGRRTVARRKVPGLFRSARHPRPPDDRQRDRVVPRHPAGQPGLDSRRRPATVAFGCDGR